MWTDCVYLYRFMTELEAVWQEDFMLRPALCTLYIMVHYGTLWYFYTTIYTSYTPVYLYRFMTELEAVWQQDFMAIMATAEDAEDEEEFAAFP